MHPEGPISGCSPRFPCIRATRREDSRSGTAVRCSVHRCDTVWSLRCHRLTRSGVGLTRRGRNRSGVARSPEMGACAPRARGATVTLYPLDRGYQTGGAALPAGAVPETRHPEPHRTATRSTNPNTRIPETFPNVDASRASSSVIPDSCSPDQITLSSPRATDEIPEPSRLSPSPGCGPLPEWRIAAKASPTRTRDPCLPCTFRVRSRVPAAVPKRRRNHERYQP